MKSNIKLLIIGAILVAALAAAVALLSAGGGGEEAAESETTAAEVLSRLLYDKDPTLIDSIKVKNESGTYEIVRYGENSWFVSEFIGVPHSASALQDICGTAATLTSQQTASENAEDLSIYGLEPPKAEVTVKFSGGADTRELLIGSEVPSGNMTYVCFKGEKTVYAAKTSDVDVYLNDKYSFIAKMVYAAKQSDDSGEDPNKISKLTVSRKDIDYDIVLEYDIRQDDPDAIYGNSSTHVMTDPVRLDLNPDKAYDVINSVMGLTADSIAVIGPSNESLERFGLTDPFCEVSFKITGGDFLLHIGDEYTDEEGRPAGRFCYAEGIDIIYKFGYDKLPWVTLLPADIAMPLIVSTYIYSVDTIDIEGSGVSASFRLEGRGNDFTVECDGESISADSFKDFYQYILKAPVDAIYFEPCSEPADLTMTICHEYGVDKLEFINSADRETIVRLNGRTSYKCRTTYVSRLTENIGHLLNGEPIIQNW